MAEPLIEVRGLKTWFPVRSGVVSRITGHVRAVDGVDLTISQGETLGLVGESGCGKSTLGRSILRLVEPTAGEVYFRGKNILRLRRGGMRRIRREMAIIFQDPFASLDPRQTVGDILGEALDIHRLTSTRRGRAQRIAELLGLVIPTRVPCCQRSRSPIRASSAVANASSSKATSHRHSIRPAAAASGRDVSKPSRAARKASRRWTQ